MRPVIESNINPTYDKAQALRLYVEKSEMDVLLQEDMERYKVALDATGGEFDDIEPISRFHEVFQGEVNAAYAAAVVGLETEAFLEQIRENVGLQNAGLLVLDSANGTVKRDAWTSNFRDMLFALDFPKLVDKPPVITPPDRLPGAVVHIPDPNLRAAIAEALGKSSNAPITVAEMEELNELKANNRGIQDLTGLQFATNLRWLNFGKWYEQDKGNQISDISPIAGLINLRELVLDRNSISDLSPVTALINLEILHLIENKISDLSPVAGLINLERLDISSNNTPDLSPVAGLINLEFLSFPDNNVSDLLPIAGLINLEHLYFTHNNISDLSPVAGLINLKTIHTWGNPVFDLSPLAGLTKLEQVDICGADLSDLTPLASLTGLKELYLRSNGISDISPLAALTGLNRLNLSENEISDISPLAGLTNLKWLAINQNKISDLSPLDGLRENIKLVWHENPVFPKGGPKIEGPWLWVLLPDTKLDSSTDLLSEASGGTVTEVEVATHGATEGQSVRDDVWTFHRLPPTGHNNIERMLQRSIRDGVIYGTVSLYSPREQETTIYVGSKDGFKVWLNGVLIYENLRYLASEDYTDFFPITLQPGRNILLVAVHTHSNGFFGFETSTEYTLSTGIGYTFSQTPIHTGDTFTLNIRAENVTDLAGW